MHHFERTIFFDEIMTSSALSGAGALSEFSFRLLEDTGWYKLANFEADYFLWGKNKGCEFITNNCKQMGYPEFC